MYAASVFSQYNNKCSHITFKSVRMHTGSHEAFVKLMFFIFFNLVFVLAAVLPLDPNAQDQIRAILQRGKE